MMLAWLRNHKSLSATVVGGALVVALVVTMAVISDGYHAQRMDLGDSAVWVTNQAKRAIGRANTEVLQLNSAVVSTSESLNVVQNSSTVWLVNHGDNTVGIVDQATSSVEKSIPLPPSQPTVHISDTTAAIEAGGSGELWLMPLGGLADFNARSSPTLSLGAGAVVSMAPDGTLFGFLPGARSVYRVDTTTGDTVSDTTKVAITGKATGMQITSVGGHWVLLDPATKRLYLAGRSVNLTGMIAADAVLAQPSDSGDTVYVASSDGLIAIGLNGGSPAKVGGAKLAAGNLGAPAAPVVVDGCAYAAWASGIAWKRCSGSSGKASTLPSPQPNALLVYQINGSRVLLNDERSGSAWAVQHGNALIDNWAELDQKKTDDHTVENNTTDKPPQYDKVQTPPVAIDDSFGARPGRASQLPVLLNDYDANGDVLVISSLSTLPNAQGQLDLIDNNQKVQITLPPTAAGTLSFEYTITDGRGGSASATVTVTVRTPSENSPPKQVRETTASVSIGGRTTLNVLSDWYDPDGDPFYLVSASVAAPDTVTFSPDGTVVYSNVSRHAGPVDVALVVADQSASGAGILHITVRAGSVPIIAEPFAALGLVGHQITISPLSHVRGGNGVVRLANVPAQPDATIVPDYAHGQFRFTTTSVGVHYLTYTVSDGGQTATGSVRVDVSAPEMSDSRPITAVHTAFIRELSAQDVDVLATDIDPTGGVLSVTGVSNVLAASGIRVDVIDGRMLRVTLTRLLDSGPIAFNYQVTNGLASAEGTVTVVQIPPLTVHQPPIANPDTVSVRVGDAITIPVLDNDSQPDGDPLTLDPKLAKPLPAGSGLLFASGNVLRYLAPDKAGNFSAGYRVSAPDGQWATAQVTIQVRERDASSNNPPIPQTVTARVFAGKTVRIPIPLTGIDPDGDSVQLLGQETNPTKGAVQGVGVDWIDYQAGEYSAGTDTFEYSVIDALGAQAVGTVRVGIAPNPDTPLNPVAVADEVTVRPGKTVSVQVLANDSDPNGSPLTVTKVQPTGKQGTATISHNVVTVAALDEPGRYGFIYQIQNALGGTSSNFLTVVVRKDAPLPRPVVSDTVLGLSDILGRTSVDVDVLSNAFFAGGSVQKLDVSLLPGYEHGARVLAGKKVRVSIGKKSQIIPFKLANPDDASVAAYAFIWVPGLDDALPQLKRGTAALTVVSEKTLTIKLNDYVIAALGKQVRLTDSSTVHATHANGANLVVNNDTLAFTSADRYFGPASISFQVTDGSSAKDPSGHVATLVLPINVTPRQNQPPSFTGGIIDFEPAQSKTIDLVKLTSYPYTKDLAELVYSVLAPKPTGFTVHLVGTKLTISADDGTPKGTHSSVLIGVKDAINTGHSGRIELVVVPSTRPLAIPQPDFAVAVRGQTTTVNVLANDEATNPFPNTPLRVIAVRGLDTASLPKGVAISPSKNDSRLTVTVSANASPGDTNLQYEVADATNDPDRYAWGSVRISVQDKPDPVSNLQVTSMGDKTLGFSWDPGAFNNSPITEFDLTVARADTRKVVTTTVCKLTTCTVATPGNGPDNAVNVSVAARNSIGLSTAVTYSGVWSNVAPAAPATVSATPLDHGLRVTWTKPKDSGGSAITTYAVTVGSATTTVSAGTYSASITDPSIPNGTPVTYSVSAHNDFYGGNGTWNSASGTATPAGPPLLVGTATAVPDLESGTSATLSWPGVFNSNGMAISGYYAAVFTGSAPSCASLQAGAGGVAPTVTSKKFSGLSHNTTYQFVVYAVNGQGCTASNVVAATPRERPGTPTGEATNGPADDGQGTLFDYRLIGVTYSSGGGYDSAVWNYKLTGDFATETGSVPGSGASPGGVLAGSGNHYGARVSVSVQVCEAYSGGQSLCGGWSAPKALGTAVSLAVGGLQFDSTARVFSWTSAPAGSGYDVVLYKCVDGTRFAVMKQTGSCDTGGASGSSATLTVRVRANGQWYTKMYLGG